MKAFLDTSVLVAAFYEDHEHHEPSFDLLIRHERKEISCAAHSLAEVFATLTAMPGRQRVTPAEAILFLGSLRERLTVVGLDAEEMISAAELAVESGAASGGIYDAVIGQSFLKSRAKWLYTWNGKHFRRLASGIGEKVRLP